MAETKKKQKSQLPRIDFYTRTPFNFCDRWCNRCDLADKCQVFQDILVHRLKHIVKGEDPDSPAVIFADMKKVFARLANIIKKDLEKQGLNSKEVKIKLVKSSFGNEPNPEDFPLWRLGHSFMLDVHLLLENIFFEEDDELMETLVKLKKQTEELNWYHAFFEAKLYRALVGQWVLEKEKDKALKKIGQEDVNVSAKLAFHSLSSCQKALEEFSQNCRGYMSWAKDLSILAKSILEKIETRFPRLHQTKIIFHGS
ncbi:hypothetical protein ISS21_01795 [Patescibacteria group bacterium]|nr:hypothetical protein [Patescibacteria group bacterium]